MKMESIILLYFEFKCKKCGNFGSSVWKFWKSQVESRSANQSGQEKSIRPIRSENLGFNQGKKYTWRNDLKKDKRLQINIINYIFIIFLYHNYFISMEIVKNYKYRKILNRVFFKRKIPLFSYISMHQNSKRLEWVKYQYIFCYLT